MANDENLKNGIATQFRSGEEAVRNGRKGGIASGESRRLKAKMIRWAEEGGYDKLVEVADNNLNNPRFWEMVASILGEPPTTRIEAEIEDRTLHVFIDDGSED